MSEDKEYLACREEEAGWSSLSEAVGILDASSEDELIQAENRATLEKLLPNLRERYQKVLQYRFFDGLTLEETASKIGVSSSRAGEIEKSALRNLKKQIYKSEMRDIPAWDSKKF